MKQLNNIVSWWLKECQNIYSINEPLVLVVTISLLILAILYKVQVHTFKLLKWCTIIATRSSFIPGCRVPSIYYSGLAHAAHQHGSHLRPYLQVQARKQASRRDILTELAKVVVRDQDETFSNRDQPTAALVLTYGGQDIAFSKNNPNWRKLRKIFVHEVLSNKNLKATSYFRRDEVRKTVKNVFDRIGTAVNIHDIAFSTETNVLTRTIWENSSNEGLKTSNLGVEINTVTSDVIKIFGRANLSDFFPRLARFDLQGVERDMKMQVNKLDALFTSIIENRIESNFKKSQEEVEYEGKKDFVQVLLDHRDEKDGVSLSMTQMKAILLDIMIGGTETTATTGEWAMTSIIHNHKVMKRVQKELVEVVGLDNIVEESHLPKLRYLEAIIKETLRMYPVVPFLLPRSPSKACIVGDYTIPMGCTILLNVWSIHRDPWYWDNPLEFNSERFLIDEWDYRGVKSVYFPFGSGRRLCAGIPLAEKMLMFILASLLHSFDWSLPKGEDHDFNEIFGIVLKKRKPLIAIPSQRLSNASLYM